MKISTKYHKAEQESYNIQTRDSTWNEACPSEQAIENNIPHKFSKSSHKHSNKL